MKEPFKSMTCFMQDDKLIPAFTQCFEFKNKAEMEFFRSAKEKEPTTLKTSSFSLMKGKKGNKSRVFFLSVYTPREE